MLKIQNRRIIVNVSPETLLPPRGPLKKVAAQFPASPYLGGAIEEEIVLIILLPGGPLKKVAVQFTASPYLGGTILVEMTLELHLRMTLKFIPSIQYRRSLLTNQHPSCIPLQIPPFCQGLRPSPLCHYQPNLHPFYQLVIWWREKEYQPTDQGLHHQRHPRRRRKVTKLCRVFLYSHCRTSTIDWIPTENSAGSILLLIILIWSRSHLGEKRNAHLFSPLFAPTNLHPVFHVLQCHPQNKVTRATFPCA